MNVTNATDVITGVKGFIETTKGVVPYEAWMGLAIILGLLVVLSRIPLVGGFAKFALYALIGVVALVFLILLGYVNF